MNKLIILIFLSLLVLSCSNSQIEDFGCEVNIPIEASEGSAILGGGSQIRYVTNGDSVINSGGGSNEYYIEEGGYVMSSGGGSLLFYVKNNGTLDVSGGGGSIDIIREEGAIVNNTLSGGG